MPTLNELIRTDAPLSTGATAIYPVSHAMEKRYRFTSRFGDEVALYRLDPDGKHIHLPRALCPVGLEDNRDPGQPANYPRRPQPRDYQIAMFDEVETMVSQGLSGVVVAFTGFGKTLIGYHAAYTLGVRTLVVTTKEDIYKQWIEGAKQFLGLPADKIGEIRGDKCEVIGTDFCVALIQSLSKEGKYPGWITNGFGLVVFDECHRVPADHFSAVASMFPAKVRLGLSATPERADGKELLVTAHIGPVRAKTEAQLMVPKVLRFQSPWQCPRVFRSDPQTGAKSVVRMPHQAGKTTHIEKMLAADPVRNHMIVDMVAAAHAKGRKVVVFSTLHEHLKTLQRACKEHGGIPGRDMGFYIGATTKAEKEQRERNKAKPVLLTTFSMMSEGTSIDWLDTAILAMPRSTVIQPVGRIRREYPDKLPPVVMDIVDHDSPVFSGYAANRVRWYNSMGAEVVEM